MPNDGAAVGHQRAPTRGTQGESRRPRTAAVSAGLQGIEGGGAPFASPCRGPAKRGPKGYAGSPALAASDKARRRRVREPSPAGDVCQEMAKGLY